MGNLFQNGPQFVRDIPAAVGDMKMLLIRRCSKDVHRKQRVPFLVSRRRLERALNRLCRPVEDGGSAALRPGGLTPEGYCGFVNRANLEQYSNTEEGAEPEGLEVQEVQQQIWPQIEKRLFAMWISSTLSLQASQVRALHEPPESVSDADRMEKTWCSLRQKLDELDFAAVGGPDELVTSTLVGYLVSQQQCVFSDRPLTDQPSMGHDQVEQILHDELKAVQELSAWEEQPLTPKGFWSSEDLAGQQTQQEMQEDLWPWAMHIAQMCWPPIVDPPTCCLATRSSVRVPRTTSLQGSSNSFRWDRGTTGPMFRSERRTSSRSLSGSGSNTCCCEPTVASKRTRAFTFLP